MNQQGLKSSPYVLMQSVMLSVRYSLQDKNHPWLKVCSSQRSGSDLTQTRCCPVCELYRTRVTCGIPSSGVSSCHVPSNHPFYIHFTNPEICRATRPLFQEGSGWENRWELNVTGAVCRFGAHCCWKPGISQRWWTILSLSGLTPSHRPQYFVSKYWNIGDFNEKDK